jgi:adenine-specific DNA-methyltransferase
MKLFETLEKQLKKENNFVTDNGELKKWVVINKAQNFDSGLIELLLDSKELKEKFFVKIKEILVFNQNLFVQFLEQKNYLNDSYTQYKNKVGLTIDRKYLKQRNEVALVWPFKDCVLEGGQSREEDKREEIFFNETLSQDEISQLLEPKVLTNAKTFDKDGEHKINGFTRDVELNKKRGLPEDTITGNLIIKGNNLLALHSLKKEFAGKVKLIYIDPPYNTGNDGFKYNDSFNQSSWMSFMKNRLEVAKQLLSKDGSIWINIDDSEAHYLKIIADEIFKKDNFIGVVIWQHSIQGKGYAGKFSLHHNYILCYSKTDQFELGQMERTEKHNINYKNPDDDPNGRWRSGDIRNALYRPNLIYEVSTPSGNKIQPPRNGWRFSKDTMQEKIDTGQVYFNKEETKLNYKIYLKDQDGRVPESIWFADEVGTTRTANSEIKKLFGQSMFETPKPEKLLQRIIHIGTNKNDIVLDFFAGSGTSGAVAHKMNRQYILTEQMDYIHDLPESRLKKVVDGEQGGISKSVNWQGGGAFTYLELKKYNQTFIDQIEEAKDSKTLLKIWEQMKVKSFLNYNVDLQKQEEHIEEFKQLELKQQKEHLVKLLDKNQLYVNLSSINDKDFEVSNDEKQATNDFYQIKQD